MATSSPAAGPAPGAADGHKLPPGWRYRNISTLWIPYHRIVLRTFYRLRIRHEVATALSIVCGLSGAALIWGLPASGSFLGAALLVHLKDVYDAVDGALARLTGTGHRLGRFLDTVGDGVVFTALIAACARTMTVTGTPVWGAVAWAVAGWLALFLQCSYYNFYFLHYVRLSGAGSASQLDERPAARETTDTATRFMARVYALWFGWQDRLIARLDLAQRRAAGLPDDPLDHRNDAWFGARSFQVANSALCFGTHIFVLVVLLLLQRPQGFLPAVAVGMTAYLAAILAARRRVFGRAAA